MILFPLTISKGPINKSDYHFYSAKVMKLYFNLLKR